MELNIDGKPCDLGSERIAVPGYAAAALADVEAAREGRSLTLTIPATMRNDALAGFARDPHTAERFNATLHTAELTAEGSVMLSGTVRMLSASDEGYRIEIRDGGAGWAKNAARRMFNALGVDFRAALTPETILAGWTDDSPVKFFPIRRDEYPQRNSPTDLLPAQRLLTVDDYHPFLHVATLVETIFGEAGYRIESRFMESELFRSLYMSGAYASRDTAALAARMGFFRPAAVVRNGEGRLFGPRGRQPEYRAQFRGKHRRDGHASDPRRRRGTGSRPEQQRRLFRFRPGQYRIHAHDRGERGIRVLPEVHHRPRDPEPPAAQRVRFGLPRHGRRHAFLAGQPLRRPPRRDRAEPQLHGDRLRPRRRKAIPSELYEERNGGHALGRILRPHGAGRHARGRKRGESRAAGRQRLPLGAVRRRLGAVRRVYRRAGRDHRRTAGAHRRRAALALVTQIFQPDLLPRGRGGHVAHPAQGMFAPAAFLVGARIRVGDHVRRRGPAPDPAVGTARSAATPLQPALPHRAGDKNRPDRTGGRFLRCRSRGRLAGENRLLAARGAGGHRPRSPRTPHMALSGGRRSRGPFRRRG